MKKEFRYMIINIINLIRIFILKNFLPYSIRDKFALRKGKCNNCSTCCIGCKLLIANRCSIYENRPRLCINFPIDKFDQFASGGGLKIHADIGL